MSKSFSATGKTIDSAPRDGTLVRVWRESNPEFGKHCMGWSEDRQRWEGVAFAVCRKVAVCWDENAPQPTHWEEV